MGERWSYEEPLRRGWQLSEDPGEVTMPEGFSYEWGADALDGPSTGKIITDRPESDKEAGEAAHGVYLAEPWLDSVGAATGEESKSVSYDETAGGPELGRPTPDVPRYPSPNPERRASDESAPLYDSIHVAQEFAIETDLARHRDPAPYPPVSPFLPAQNEGGSDVSHETVGDSGEADLDTPIAREAKAAVEALTRRAEPLPRPARTRTFLVANQKGGVGKTTTTVNIAAALAQYGAKVLVVDLDPQGNASTALGIDHHADVPSIYDVLVEQHTMEEVVQPVPDIEGLYCAPATIDLAGAEIELVSMVARESRLGRALEAYQESMDYILVDCPPSLGLLTVNALVAGDEVLIPIQCEYYALEGLGQLLRNIELVRGHLNPRLHVSTILLTMYDARTRLASQVADEVRTHFPNEVLRTAVPRSVRISEAPSYSQTVMTYDPASSGALAYREAAREIAERGFERDGAQLSLALTPRGADSYAGSTQDEGDR